jgi:nitrogen fixation protein NifQ
LSRGEIMETAAVYNWLIGVPGASCSPDDAHAVASMIAMAVRETELGGALTVGLGIAGAELRDLISSLAKVSVSEDESCLRELLSRHSTSGTRLELRLAAMIARRAMRSNHLWQDVGLRGRHELSALMARHFAPLAIRNKRDMKWKKFFYRMICRDEGFRLCTAPSCSECDDFAVCFGDESGESLLARIRRDAEMPVQIDVSLISLAIARS